MDTLGHGHGHGALTLRSSSRAFGGTVGVYSHESTSCATEMRFSVFVPPQAQHGPVPSLYFLAGLGSTEETFMTKAGALRLAAEHGILLVAPDTSPRAVSIPGDSDHWDFGKGAGFYLDATEAPWSAHYRMYSYVTAELPAVIAAHFPASDAKSIFGHSMGGHGALVIGLRQARSGAYRSVSAFAPICHPMEAPWGTKAFTNFLGPDQARWAAYDATALAAALSDEEARACPPILVDQGTADQFLPLQLHPERFEAACAARALPLTFRRQPGYDHGYYFIGSFVEDHLRFHAGALQSSDG